MTATIGGMSPLVALYSIDDRFAKSKTQIMLRSMMTTLNDKDPANAVLQKLQ
jgi:hypothetical protein